VNATAAIGTRSSVFEKMFVIFVVLIGARS
jgi:hypothetical protein